MAKFTIAVFQLPGSTKGAPNVFLTSDFRCSGYAKISQDITVDIPLLEMEDSIRQHLDALAKEERALVATHLSDLQNLNDRRQKLLAITHEATDESPRFDDI